MGYANTDRMAHRFELVDPVRQWLRLYILASTGKMGDSSKRNSCQPAWMFETYSAFGPYDGAQCSLLFKFLQSLLKYVGDQTELRAVDR